METHPGFSGVLRIQDDSGLGKSPWCLSDVTVLTSGSSALSGWAAGLRLSLSALLLRGARLCGMGRVGFGSFQIIVLVFFLWGGTFLQSDLRQQCFSIRRLFVAYVVKGLCRSPVIQNFCMSSSWLHPCSPAEPLPARVGHLLTGFVGIACLLFKSAKFFFTE